MKIVKNQNYFSHIVHLGITDYLLVTTGYCDTEISSRKECEEAAYNLGIPDTSAVTSSRSERPYGCISSRKTGNLYWNQPRRNNPSCGTTHGNSIRDCICGPAGNIVEIFIIINS